MNLQDESDALRAEFIRTAPPGRAELYDAKVEELQRTFPIEKAMKTGDHAPEFTLPNPSGRPVSLGSEPDAIVAALRALCADATKAA